MTYKKIAWRKVCGWILFVTLVGSIVYSIIQIVLTPVNAQMVQHGERLRSDYILMLTQCILGLIVMFLPTALEHKWNIDIPNSMYVMYFLFLYGAIYLGEVRNFYFLIPYWDTILHGFSAMMLGAFGFLLVSILNGSKNTSVQLSPAFVGLFAFCFALSVGALWEIYEYLLDGLLSMNMQKFRLENGTELIGRKALMDTMGDFITDACGALIVSVWGAQGLARKKHPPQSVVPENSETECRE